MQITSEAFRAFYPQDIAHITGEKKMADSSDEDNSSSQFDVESTTERQRPKVVRGGGRRGRPARRHGRTGGRAASVRGRGNARGRSRRESIEARERRRTEVETTTDQRQQLVEEKIHSLDGEEAKKILVALSKEEPSVIFRVMEVRRVGLEGEPSSSSNKEPDQPSWCVCTRWREMTTEQERVCCGYRPQDCESQLPNFRLVCLDPEVLRVAQTYRIDFLANAPDRDPRREKRHTGYRQYILWKYGRLGEGVRMVISSCCVWAIRDTYPDALGFYVGFKDGRTGM